MAGPVYDVIQIGYGPVSASLALMLGRQARSVAVVERWTERYPLPRAVCVDHELYRVLSANGLGNVLAQVTHSGPKYQWFNADWRELLVIDWAAESISGGAEVNFVHQPTLEAALSAAVLTQPSVDLHLGWEAVAVKQDTDLAHVTLRRPGSDEEKHLSARYIIGCDGANSLVRQAIGGEREDRGFEADWLVIDVLLKPGVTIEQLGIPAAGQYCNPVRPTTIVPAGVRDGRTFRRWEFMRLPGEDVASLEAEAKVWELLAPWAGPDQVDLVRHKVYNFRSLLASRWRDRRLLIAGDAAHVMPPFMGQGMCSGMRDVWNLAWKLGLVLDGVSSDGLLDTYQLERAPHVSAITDISIYLGKIICIPDASAAAARDDEFLSGRAEPPPRFPQLDNGLLGRNSAGVLLPGAGQLAPHVALDWGGQRGRLDDLTGGGFLVIAHGVDPRTMLAPAACAVLDRIGTQYIVLEPGSTDGAVDLDGRLVAFLVTNQWQVMIVRPDFYVYAGTADASELPALVESLIAGLAVVPRSPARIQEVLHEAG